MRLIFVVLVVSIFFSCADKAVERISMKEDVAFLASDSLNGRKTGTEGERMAADYIRGRFENLGLQPKGSDGYFQKFSFKNSSDPHKEAELAEGETEGMLTGVNVIGYLDNKAENTVVIGAHYDHLGMGGEGSLHREGEAVHNGADDNASGVAVMLRLAEQLRFDSAQHEGFDSAQRPKKNNYLFIAFSGEEEGLLGSNYFVKNPTIDTKKVTYMINMDMVGRLNTEKTLAVYGVGTSPMLKQTVNANIGDLKIMEHESGVGPSDHTSFYLANIPVLHFFTGQHQDYHKPTDDAEKLNYAGMEMISDYIFSIVKDLDKQDKLPFRKTKNESEVVPDFKVTLGVVPDYLFSGKGMRIDGVSEDRPAQKAGLQKGDVVVKMGDFDVIDMMSYMECLSKFEKGEVTTVTVERDGTLLEKAVTF